MKLSGMSVIPCALLMAAVLFVSPLEAGGTATLSLGAATVLPGQEGATLPLMMSTSDPVNALVIHLSFESTQVQLQSVTIDEGVLAGHTFEVSSINFSPNGAEATLRWTLDSTAPFTGTLPAGDDQVLAVLHWNIESLQLPGATNSVRFTTDSFPSTANEVFQGGVGVAPLTVDGEFTISDENYFIIEEHVTSPATTNIEVPVLGFNAVSIQGYSMAITFDETLFRAVDFMLGQSVDDIVQAEFVQEILDNSTGTAILGVLFDAIPPFADQQIPAFGAVLTLGTLHFDVVDGVLSGSSPLEFVDGLGSPPIDNIYVVENLSVTPIFDNGELRIVEFPPFIRGDSNEDGSPNVVDAVFLLNVLFREMTPPSCQKVLDVNDDGKLNVVDAVYLLNYLFLEKPAPPPPFPKPGLDPTPDEIPCKPL